jgi:hypothetical protein
MVRHTPCEVYTSTVKVRRVRQRRLEARRVQVGVGARATVYLRKVLKLWDSILRIGADAILGSMGHEVGDRPVVLHATAHWAARMDRNRANDIASGASHSVRHGPAHTESFGKDARCVDAQPALQFINQLQREVDVSPICVGPAVAEGSTRGESLRCDEDRTVLRQGQEAVEGLVGYDVRAETRTMISKDQPVRLVLVVVARNPNVVAAGRSIDGRLLSVSARDGGCPPAAVAVD